MFDKSASMTCCGCDMRSFEAPITKAKAKLLDAAENQVSNKGFDAVSVRDVTQMAKANVAAVNYHFGSREGMMGLMMARRMSPIHEHQLQNLDVLENKRGKKPIPLEELLDAWLRPLFVDAEMSDPAAIIRRKSAARILQVAVVDLPQPLKESGTELWARYLKAFARCLNDLANEEIAWRLHLLNGAVFQSLMGISVVSPWGNVGEDGSNAELCLRRLLRLAAPMMREGAFKAEDETKPRGPQGTFDF